MLIGLHSGASMQGFSTEDTTHRSPFGIDDRVGNIEELILIEISHARLNDLTTTENGTVKRNETS